MDFRFVKGTALAILALSGMDAFGGSSSTSIDDFRVVLVDLDPTDGVSPAVAFTGQSFARSSISVPDGWPGPVLVGMDQHGASAFDPVVSDSEWDQGSALALLQPDGADTGEMATTNASAFSQVVPGLTVAELLFGGTFVLSPNTQLLVEGNGQGQSFVSGAASIFLDLGGLSSNGIRQDATFSASTSWGTEWAQSFTLVFTNAGDAPAQGYFNARLLASAVPEPANAALWVFAIGMLCATRRRTPATD